MPSVSNLSHFLALVPSLRNTLQWWANWSGATPHINTSCSQARFEPLSKHLQRGKPLQSSVVPRAMEAIPRVAVESQSLSDHGIIRDEGDGLQFRPQWQGQDQGPVNPYSLWPGHHWISQAWHSFWLLLVHAQQMLGEWKEELLSQETRIALALSLINVWFRMRHVSSLSVNLPSLKNYIVKLYKLFLYNFSKNKILFTKKMNTLTS